MLKKLSLFIVLILFSQIMISYSKDLKSMSYFEFNSLPKTEQEEHFNKITVEELGYYLQGYHSYESKLYDVKIQKKITIGMLIIAGKEIDAKNKKNTKANEKALKEFQKTVKDIEIKEQKKVKAANQIKIDEFKPFWNEFKEKLNKWDVEYIKANTQFPVIFGSGGDANYNYNFFNNTELFIAEDLKACWKEFKKKKNIFESTVKSLRSLSDFTYGMEEMDNNGKIITPADKDWADFIPNGTEVISVIYSSLFGDHSSLSFIMHFSKFDGKYKFWGFTRGG